MTEIKTAILQTERIDKFRVDMAVSLAGSVLLGIFSQISIPLPFTPIPLTLQTLGVFLLGGLLGSRRALYSVVSYLIQGSIGLPVFAGGVANPLWILEPKAGFLFSFLLAAYVIGRLIESKSRLNWTWLLFVLTIGQMIIFVGGVIGLSFYVGATKAICIGVIPFLLGAVIKVCWAALVIKLRNWVKS